MELNKEPLSFILFSPKKVLLMHTELFVRRMIKMLVIRTYTNWFK